MVGAMAGAPALHIPAEGTPEVPAGWGTWLPTLTLTLTHDQQRGWAEDCGVRPPEAPSCPPLGATQSPHLQPFSSVNGSQGSQHPQDPQNLHHRYGAGPEQVARGRAEGSAQPPASCSTQACFCLKTLLSSPPLPLAGCASRIKSLLLMEVPASGASCTARAPSAGATGCVPRLAGGTKGRGCAPHGQLGDSPLLSAFPSSLQHVALLT